MSLSATCAIYLGTWLDSAQRVILLVREVVVVEEDMLDIVM